MKNEIGVVHGRFQVLHKDHLKYILAGKEKCEHLIIGIANPDILLTKFSKNAPHRSEKASNPLSYYDRFQCIKYSLLEAGLKREEFDIVPFPINFPEKLEQYVPKDAVYFMTIYDEWGEEKFYYLNNKLHLNVDILWRKPLKEKGLCSSDIRKKIYNDEIWEDLVPKSVYDYILKNNLDIVIKNSFKE